MGRKKDKFYKKELDMISGCKDCQDKNCKWNGKVAVSGTVHKGGEKFNCSTSRKRDLK